MAIQQHYTYIIIGAGIAGLSAIKSIRESDNRSILLISNEDRLPYKRTQINKLICKGFSKNEMAIYDSQYYIHNDIELQFGQASNLNTVNQTINLNGYVIGYDKLLFATGQIPHTIDTPSTANNRIFTIYQASDSERLISFAKQHSRFLIVGGGVEGVEIAYQLFLMDKMVTLAHRSSFLIIELGY